MDLESLNREFEEKMKVEEAGDEGAVSKKTGKVKRTVIAIILLLLLLTALSVAFLPGLIKSNQRENEAPNIEAAVMDGLPEGVTEEDLLKSLQEEMDGSMFKVTQQTRAVFKNGSADGTVNIINAEGNNLPAKIVIENTNDGTVLYDSGDLIWPGKYIPAIRLKEKLKKGSYDAKVIYYVYDEEGEEEKGVISAAMEIVVQQ